VRVWIFEPKRKRGPSGETINSLTPTYGTSEERWFFNLFIKHNNPLIGKYSSHHFWTTIIPQASWNHPAVKHALIAAAMAQRE